MLSIGITIFFLFVKLLYKIKWINSILFKYFGLWIPDTFHNTKNTSFAPVSEYYKRHIVPFSSIFRHGTFAFHRLGFSVTHLGKTHILAVNVTIHYTIQMKPHESDASNACNEGYLGHASMQVMQVIQVLNVLQTMQLIKSGKSW